MFLNYHGVDNFFKKQEIISYDDIKIISIGRIAATKGFMRLVECHKKTNESGLFSIDIVGEGNEDLFNALAEYSESSDSFNIHGWMNQNMLLDYYNNFNVFTLLANNNFHDGLPNVLLEAMSLGKVCIISNLPSAEEIINHGENGFIINIDDDYTSEFIKIITLLKGNKSLIDKISSNAVSSIENLSLEKVSSKIYKGNVVLKISIAVITKNEEQDIKSFLDSFGWVDEKLLLMISALIKLKK